MGTILKVVVLAIAMGAEDTISVKVKVKGSLFFGVCVWREGPSQF